MDPRRDSRSIAVRRFGAVAVLATWAASWGCGDGFPLPRLDEGIRETEYVGNPVGQIALIEGAPGELPRNFPTAWLFDAPPEPQARLGARDGECEIWIHPSPDLCETQCWQGSCVGPDECAPWPVPMSAGEIAVAGLVEPVLFSPHDYGYTAEPEILIDDVFGDDASIVVNAAGDELAGFRVELPGVVPLEADLSGLAWVQDGVDEVVRWSAVGEGRIQLRLGVGHHGAPFEALLVCESDDDGELVVPGALIAQLPQDASRGLLPHPSWLARFHRDVVDTAAGPVELFVASTVRLHFRHARENERPPAPRPLRSSDG